MFVTLGMTWICMMLPGQAASMPAENWLAVYSGAVRLELGEGDLAEAAAGYRRVLVSKAPESYKQAAKYRLAGVLGRLGKVAEKKAILESLQKELNEKAAGGISDSSGAPRGAPRGAQGRAGALGNALGAQVVRELAEMAAAEGARDADNGPLRQAIAARDSGLIREAARALAIADGPEGMRVLMATYKAEPDGSMVKAALLESLGEAGWPAAVEEIRRALDGKSAGAAETAVGMIGDGQSAGALVNLLGHTDPEVRRQAARGLRMLRYVPAVEPLIELAGSDTDNEVRSAAADALQAIGTARAVAAVASQPVRDPAFVFPAWYRKARVAEPVVQKEFGPIGEVDTGRAPRIGVVVSAMSHHAPPYERLPVPYLRQIRKAWVLQRAGFEVCLLAEPEVLIDPAGKDLGQLFEPPIEMYGLGRWPACDAMVVDQVHHLPAEVAQTILAYSRNGGKVVVCGAAGGSWCGDEVAWRSVVGVRFPHAHAFRDEAVVLSWQGNGRGGEEERGRGGETATATADAETRRRVDAEQRQTRRHGDKEAKSNNYNDNGHGNDSHRLTQIDADNNKDKETARAEARTLNGGPAERGIWDGDELPTVSRADWAAHRSGTFYSHDLLGGRVLAVLQTPAIWAIKVQEVGRGRVLCINWDIGMNTDGARDEDQLFCRCVDVVLGQVGQRTAVRYAMMRHVRWGRLADAKQCVSGEKLRGLGDDERIETLVQLYRVHRLENNEAAGEVMCRRLLRDSGSASEAEKVLGAAMRPWPRVQITSSIGGEVLWWRDVPEWLATPRGVPLWLAGPGAVPATVRVRVELAGDKDGEEGSLRANVEGARIVAVRDMPAAAKAEQTARVCRMRWSGGAGGSADLEIALERMDGRVTCGE